MNVTQAERISAAEQELADAVADLGDDLSDFMLTRIAAGEERLRAEGVRIVEPGQENEDESYRLLVTIWDQLACARTLVHDYVRAEEGGLEWQVRRRVVLVLAQVYEQHPGFEPTWLTELVASRSTPIGG